MKMVFRMAFVLALLASGGCDEQDDRDLKKAVFELTQDVYLYCYCGKYHLVEPPRFAEFTMEQFKRDPSVGVIDKESNIAYIAIVPKGTRVQYTGTGKYFHWANGCWQHYPYGKILGDQFSRYRKVSLCIPLRGSPGDKAEEFFRVIRPTPNEGARPQAGDSAGGSTSSSR